MDPSKEQFPNLQPPQQDSPPVYIQHAAPGYGYTPQMAMVPVAIVPAAVVGAQYQSESGSNFTPPLLVHIVSVIKNDAFPHFRSVFAVCPR
jgi:hypothetical protein